MKVFRGDCIEAQAISWMITSQSEGRSDETLRSRKKGKVTHKEHGKTPAPASATLESLLSPSTSETDDCGKYRLRAKLEAVRRSDMRSYFWSQKMDTGNGRPTNSSVSGKNEPSLSRSSDRHKDADPGHTRAGQEKHETEFTDFEDGVLSKPSSNGLSSTPFYNSSIPSYYPSLPLLAPSKWNGDRNNTSQCSLFPQQFHISAGDCSPLYLQKSASFFTLVASYQFLL